MILPYINIEPSQKKKLSDIRLITINNISKEIESKNYSNSIILINSIDEDNEFFSETINQLSIAATFKKLMEEI